MSYIDVLKELKVNVQDLPKDIKSKIKQYNIGIEKIKEAEAFELSEEDTILLQAQKEELSSFESEINIEINKLYENRDQLNTPAVEVSARKRGRPSKVEVSNGVISKDINLVGNNTIKKDEKQTPVKKRGRPSKAESFIVPVNEEAIKPIQEVVDVVKDKVAEPVIRRGRPTNTEVKAPIKKEKEIKPLEPVDTISVKEDVIFNDNERNVIIENISNAIIDLKDEDKALLNDSDIGENKEFDITVEVESDEFDLNKEDIEVDVEENLATEQKVAELQDEIEWEFDRVEKSSKNKRKVSFGIGFLLAVSVAAFCGINFLKESK